jgi:VanZ family protein
VGGNEQVQGNDAAVVAGRPWRRVGLAVAAVGVVLLTPLPHAHRLWSVPMDLGHAVLGIALTWFLARRLQARGLARTRAWALGWLGAFVTMAVFEALQAFTGRSPSVEDAVLNGLGGLAAMAYTLGSSGGRRLRGAALALVPCVVVLAPAALTTLDVWHQGRTFPLLSDLETQIEMMRWAGAHADIERVPDDRPGGGWCVAAHLQPGPWPGVVLRQPYADWRGLRALSFAVRLPAPAALQLLVADRTHDDTYSDRFNASYDLPAGWSVIEVPLEDIAAAPRTRRMDMGAIGGLEWFLLDVQQPITIHVDDVRLVR